MKTIRHGDIPLHKIDKLPEGLIEVKHKGEYVLAEGETTGHMHRLRSNDMKVYTDSFGERYLVMGEIGEVSHEEHKTLKVGKGIYRVGKEREVDWFSQSVRKVID